MIKINVKDSKTQDLIREVEIDMFVVAVDGPEPSIDLFVDSEQSFFGGAVTTAEMAGAEVVEPVAAAEPEYVANGSYTIQQLLDAGWSYDQMVSEGHATLVAPAVVETAAAPTPTPTPEPEAPAAPVAPVIAAAPEAPVVPEVVAEPEPTMTAKAAGATRQQFLDTGWTDDQLVDHGYMELPVEAAPATPEAPATPAAPAAAEWPRQHEGDWIDSTGEVWSADKHAKSASSDVPPVTAKGVFKKRRGGGKSAPATPAAPESSAPVAPSLFPVPEAVVDPAPPLGAPAAPSAAATDAAVVDGDAELADIIKSWNKEA
jgi:hypothetical protein